jgi:glycosyltransferase involved in cell wall biosynthesis
MPRASLIVAVYDRIDFLAPVLKSIANQRFRDFEVIVAEDNDSVEMRDFISAHAVTAGFPLAHVSQPHRGFGKNRILNAAVRRSSGEILIFVDGDCILHPRFIGEYMRRADDRSCFFGRRVLLDPVTTRHIVESGDVTICSLPRLLFTRAHRKEDGLYAPFLHSMRKWGIYGSSFCVVRPAFFAINGFDEDFTGPYFGEDADVERRLYLHGVKIKCARFKVIQYHLHHGAKHRPDAWKTSRELFVRKKEEGLSYCRNGLEKRD